MGKSHGEHSSACDPFLFRGFFDSNRGLAITPVSLERTDTGGTSWTTLISKNAEKSFHALVFTTPRRGFVVGLQKKNDGYAPMILRSEDGGENWQECAIDVATFGTDIKPRLQSVSFCDPQIGWAAGSDLILHTDNGGRTWEGQRIGHNEGLFGVACLSADRAVAVGQEGLILQTRDGGKSWYKQASGKKDNFLRVRFVGNEGWILGGIAGNGILLRTLDGGASWQPQELNLSGPLFDIHLNGEQGWIVGAGGTILATDDGGQTWTRQQSPTTNDLTCLFFLPSGEAWAGGDKRTLLHFSK
jgi:photosystem II stability/assembly factor-like uncharacterized protein